MQNDRTPAETIGVTRIVVPASSPAHDPARSWAAEVGARLGDDVVVDSVDLDGPAGDADLGPGDLLVVTAHHTGHPNHELVALTRERPCPTIVMPAVYAAVERPVVLVGLDGSAANYLVADWARQFAAVAGRPLHGAFATIPMYETFDNAGNYGDAELRARYEADTELADLHERPGPPATVLSDLARELRAFLTVVAIGAHRSPFDGHLHGVAATLISSPPGPVAVLPPRFLDTWSCRDVTAGANGLGLRAEDWDRLRGAETVMTLTDDRDDAALSDERRFAARLAGTLGARLALLDRSEATWTIAPEVDGPFHVDEMRARGHGVVADQMDEASRFGVRDVIAVAPTSPAFDAVADAARLTDADVIVVPSHLSHPSLAERWHHHGDVGASVKQLVGDRHVVVTDAHRPRVM